jgi:pentatricopeptide repeat protein
MLLESVFPDKILFVSIFEGCHCASEVKYMHVYTLNMGYDSDVIIKNALVNMYARFSNLSYARMTFQDMSQRTVVSWTTLISAYLQHGLAEEALQLFQQMFLECVLPDNVTFVNVLAACTKINALTEGKRMHSCVFCSDCKLDETVHNAILHLYGKCGSLKDAQKMFRSMVKRDLVSWNAMIAAYAHNGHLKGSFHLYRLMRDEDLVPDKVTFLCLIEGCTKQEALAEGIWVHNNMLDTGFGIDVVTATALIEMYGRCGNFDAASDIFEALQDRDVIIWTAFIVACIHTERGKTALQNFQQLQMQAVMPNNVTFVNVILACANQADEQEGKHVHVRARACDLEETVVIGTALVDLYGKCGNVEEARKLFNILPERDSFSWNAMITAYAQHGDGECALQVFGHMQFEGLIPDEVTLSVILRACSHTGFIDEAYQYLSLIIVRYNIKSLVDYCVRIVDLLSRAGQLSDAENLMNQMPYQPCGILWATMLGACSLHLDVDRGERAATYALELSPMDIIPYVALSNLYAASGNVLDDIVI